MSDTDPTPVTKDTRRLRIPAWLVYYGPTIGWVLLGLVIVLILWALIAWVEWDEGAWLGLVGLIVSSVMVVDAVMRR